MSLYIGTYQEHLADVNNQVARMAAKYGADAFVAIGSHFGGRPDIDTIQAQSITGAIDAIGDPYVVALETGSTTMLREFDPFGAEDVLYVLGPSNGTLPDWVLDRAHEKVTIEAPFGVILPTPACAGIVLHHHYVNTRVAA